MHVHVRTCMHMLTQTHVLAHVRAHTDTHTRNLTRHLDLLQKLEGHQMVLIMFSPDIVTLIV